MNDTENLKQVIILRTDLNMRKGKMVAQGAHASMKVFFDRFIGGLHTQSILNTNNSTQIIKQMNKSLCVFDLNDDMIKWMTGLFTKITLGVNSEEGLLKLYQQALDSNLPVALIKDCGLTEFHGIPTNTCIAIGPARSEEIDKITRNLKLI